MFKNCFFVSPIGNPGSDTRAHADRTYKYIIKPVCEDLNLNCVRADEMSGSSVITDDIFEALTKAELVIADISELNANVFLELGYRLARGGALVIVKDKEDQNKYPFDISSIRILEYSTHIGEVDSSKELLKSFVNKAIEGNHVRITHISSNSNGEYFWSQEGECLTLGFKKKD